jgi:hypothetical protein
MYRMNDGWTDERMDDFRDEVYRRFDKLEGGVDRRFDGVDQRFDRFEGDVDRRFDEVVKELHRINDRLDGMYRASYVIGGGIIVALVGVIVQL